MSHWTIDVDDQLMQSIAGFICKTNKGVLDQELATLGYVTQVKNTGKSQLAIGAWQDTDLRRGRCIPCRHVQANSDELRDILVV